MKMVRAFCSFSTDDLEKARQFYGVVLGLPVEERGNMGLEVGLPNGNKAFIYPKEDHVPATYTVLNFVVEDIDAAVDELTRQGVKMEQPNMGEFLPDEKGIYRSEEPDMGPTIAWFKDPAGNFLSVIQE